MAVYDHYWISTSSTSWVTAANWSTGVVPGSTAADTHNVILNHIGTASIAGSSGTSLTVNGTNVLNLNIYKEKSYTGSVGSISGTSWVYLAMGVATSTAGLLNFEPPSSQGGPSGSPLFMVRSFSDTTASNLARVYIYDSASQSSQTYYPPLNIRGNCIISQSGGSASFCIEPGATGTATVDLSKGTGTVSPKMYIGKDATVTTINAETGTIINNTGTTVATTRIDGDALYQVFGSVTATNGVHTALTIGYGAKCDYRSLGTVTTLNVAGSFDRTADNRALTITDMNLYRGASLLLDNGKPSSTTRTNAPAFVQCSQQDVKITMPIGERF